MRNFEEQNIPNLNPKNSLNFSKEKKTNKTRKASKKLTGVQKSKKGSEILVKKFLHMGEIFLSKFPLMKIVPIMKRNQNRNFMWIIFFVIKFVKILKDRTFINKYKKLTNQHFNLINDNAKVSGVTTKIFKRTTTNLNDNFLRKKVKLFFYF